MDRHRARRGSLGDGREEALDAIREALALYFEDDDDAEIREVAEARVERMVV